MSKFTHLFIWWMVGITFGNIEEAFHFNWWASALVGLVCGIGMIIYSNKMNITDYP